MPTRKRLALARGKFLDNGEGASGEHASLQDVTLHRAHGSTLDAAQLTALVTSRGEEPVVVDVLRGGPGALASVGPLGRGLVIFVTDCDITACFHKCANGVHLVVFSGQDERGIPATVNDIHIALIFDEQHHDIRVAIGGRPVQRMRLKHIIKNRNERRPPRNESLGFCRLPTRTGIGKFLVDVQSAFMAQSAHTLAWQALRHIYALAPQLTIAK